MQQTILNLTLAVTMLTISTLANAAIPPMSESMRQWSSDTIVTGTVVAVTHVDIQERGEGSDYIDRKFTAKVKVDAVHKPESATLPSIITVTFWKPFKRPHGWTGGQGQNGILTAGESVKLYLTHPKDDIYRLIEPNGIDWLKSDDSL
jgi:hypothetical protein